ncbi:MAG: hypothetical protein NHF93_00410 [Candidatus Shikimatogenerans bostrichidophilus]|nr:MAG: hypothetical protein NHF93_00410 [Candidatus Shikimatogenerans bostrichidophilus]
MFEINYYNDNDNDNILIYDIILEILFDKYLKDKIDRFFDYYKIIINYSILLIFNILMFLLFFIYKYKKK